MSKAKNPQAQVDRFNAEFKIGDEVEYRGYPEAPPQRFKTSTVAEVLSGHTAVVWLEGKSGCVSCDSLCKASASTPPADLERPYLETTVTTVERKYNPKYGDDRRCNCGHTYSRHFDSYDEMAPIGCKYCPCYIFQEAKRESAA